MPYKDPGKARAAQRKSYLAHREKICAKNRKRRTTPDGREKDRLLAIAYRHANRERMNAKQLAWGKANPEKVCATQARYRAAHPDVGRHYYLSNRARIRARQGERSKTPEGRAKDRARQAAWVKANPERSRAHYAKYIASEKAKAPGRGRDPAKIRARNAAQYVAKREARLAKQSVYYAANREKILAREADARKADPEKHRSRGHKRRATLRAAKVEPFTARELRLHLARLGGKCIYCDGPYEHIDHLVPIARGGAHSLFNLVPACAGCNHRKHKRLVTEWLRGDHLARVLAFLKQRGLPLPPEAKAP